MKKPTLIAGFTAAVLTASAAIFGQNAPSTAWTLDNVFKGAGERADPNFNEGAHLVQVMNRAGYKNVYEFYSRFETFVQHNKSNFLQSLDNLMLDARTQNAPGIEQLRTLVNNVDKGVYKTNEQKATAFFRLSGHVHDLQNSIEQSIGEYNWTAEKRKLKHVSNARQPALEVMQAFDTVNMWERHIFNNASPMFAGFRTNAGLGQVPTYHFTKTL